MISLFDGRLHAFQRVPNLVLYLAYLISTALFSCLALLVLCSHCELGWLSRFTIGFIFFGVLSFILFISLWDRDRQGIEQVFALVAPPILFMFVFLMMPFAVPDEFTHINRMFDNRSGAETLLVPAQMLDAYEWITDYQTLWFFLNEPFDYSDLKETEFVAGGYSVVCYFLPSVCSFFGKALGINGYWVIYLARLTNALVFLAAAYWMLRRCPVLRPFLFVFLLNPMLLQQECSCSADVLCNIGILCFLVQTIYIIVDRKCIEKREILILLVFFALVVACKFAYVPLCLAGLALIPLVKSRRIRLLLLLLFIVLALLCVLVALAMGYMSVLLTLLDASTVSKFFLSLLATLETQSGILLWQFSGGNLGWPYMNGQFAPVSISVPVLWVGYVALLALSLAASPGGEFIGIPQRLLFFFVSLFEIVLLFFALWQGFDSCEAVTWHQGRYFIPPALLLAFSLLPPSNKLTGKVPVPALAGAMVGYNLFSLGCVVLFF